MPATQIAVYSIPTSIEIGGGAHLASLCRPLPGLSYYCSVIEGVPLAPLKSMEREESQLPAGAGVYGESSFPAAHSLGASRLRLRLRLLRPHRSLGALVIFVLVPRAYALGYGAAVPAGLQIPCARWAQLAFTFKIRHPKFKILTLPPTRCARGSGYFCSCTQGLRPGLKAGVPGGTLNSACLRLA